MTIPAHGPTPMNILTLALMLTLTLTLTLASPTSTSTPTSTPSVLLQQLMSTHVQQYGLTTTSTSTNANTNMNGNDGIQVYIYHDIQYVQLCYTHTEQTGNIIPKMIHKRSYTPIIKTTTNTNIQSSSPQSIRCYNIFNKLQLIEQPIILSPLQQSQPIHNNNNNNNNNNRRGKQIQYLQQQYQMYVWLYDLGSRIRQQLTPYNRDKNKNNRLGLNGLNRFSVYGLLANTNPNMHKQQQNDKQDDKQDTTSTSSSSHVSISPQLYISNIHASSSPSSKTSDKVHKKLSGRGFHQQTTYTIKLDPSSTSHRDINNQQCQLYINQVLPYNMYIDIDQIKSHGFMVELYAGNRYTHRYNNTNTNTNTNIDSNIDSNQQYGDGISYINIQKPSYQSKQYQYTLIIPWNKLNNTNINQYQIKVPVHYRYVTPYHHVYKTTTQKGNKNNNRNNNRNNNNEEFVEYVQVDLYPIKNAYVGCYQDKVHKKTNKKTGQAGKGDQYDNNQILIKYKLEQDYLITKGTALVPVGDGEMKSVVSVVTLVSQIICAILLVRQLRK